MAALQEHALRSQDPGAAPVHTYPPTLFSDANYKASCEGMAARDMRNFAGDIGFQTFYQGIYLVLIAIATGFLKLIGFCVRRDTDRELLRKGMQPGKSLRSTSDAVGKRCNVTASPSSWFW